MKIVFFGSIGVARKILEEIVLKQDNIELLGVVCDSSINEWRNEASVYVFAKEMNIKILSLEDILTTEPDIGISVRFNKIISADVINRFKYGIVNTHGGILPEYRGSYCNINAIINGEEEFGVTLHYIDLGVDTGDVVDTLKVKISENNTGYELYKYSEQMCYEIIKKNISALLSNTNDRVSQDYLIKNEKRKTHTYYSKNTINKKEINLDNITESYDLIRAFDSPYHEPAFLKLDGKKVYLRTKH